MGPTQVAENLERLRAWWADLEDRQPRRATDYGLGALEYEVSPQAFLLKLLTLAGLVVGDRREADRWQFVNRLDRVRFFPRLATSGQDLYALLSELDFLGGSSSERMLGEHLLTVVRQREVLAGAPELPNELAAMTDGPALVARLRALFFHDLPVPEPHWVVREMVLLGIWRAPSLRAVASVPERVTRQAAHRLGLLESPYASDSDELLAASMSLGAVLGPDLAFDEPVWHLGAQLGCRSGCPHTKGCAYHCRERYDL